MKVSNVNMVLKSPTGVEIKDGPEAKGITLKEMLERVLVTPLQTDAELGLQKMVMLGGLLERISKAKKELELSSEEVTILKERTAKIFGVVVTWAIVKALEG